MTGSLQKDELNDTNDSRLVDHSTALRSVKRDGSTDESLFDTPALGKFRGSPNDLCLSAVLLLCHLARRVVPCRVSLLLDSFVALLPRPTPRRKRS